MAGKSKKSAERRIFMESLAEHNIRHHKPPKFLIGKQIKHLVTGSSV
jgi:hypothetical protein